VLYSSLSKKKKRTVQTEKIIKLAITVGYSKNLITEAKKRNLPILGLTDTENPFFLDYLVAGNVALSSSVYLNFNLLFYFLNEFYRK
jgi:ribosomal protein S2